jgi:DNA-binding transcriptional LysR family regulator
VRLSWYREKAAPGNRSNGGAVLKVAVLAGHGLVCLPIYLVDDLLQLGGW